MLFRSSCLCLTLVILFCAVVNTMHVHRVEKREYKQHLQRVEKYQKETSCNVPRETLVQRSEITFNRPIFAHQIISPPVTVLHRCESCSGCPLQPGHSCTAKSSEQVTQVFYLVESSRKNEYLLGTALNHTSCWCQPTISQPK